VVNRVGLVITVCLLAPTCGGGNAAAGISGTMTSRSSAPPPTTTVEPPRPTLVAKLRPQRPTAAPTTTTASTLPPTTTTTMTPPTSLTTTTTTLTPIVLHQTLQKPAVPQFTLSQLIDYFFAEDDQAWALRVAFCESSAQPDDLSTDAIHSSSRASGWFQHLPKFWEERSEKAGFGGVDIMDPVANVGVAAWLLYHTPQGSGHWYPSESCWG
jgi:hypothetical protein